MSTAAIVVTVVVVVVVVALAAVALRLLRRRKLQHRFGSEYDRQVAQHSDRGSAEKELRQRQRDHAQLDIKPLDDHDRDRYAQEWTAVQAQFVEDPAQAVSSADELVTRVMKDRGYPTGGFDEQVSTLSVEHSSTLDHYREAHAISLASQRGQASTEQLRQGFVDYRTLADDLLGTEPDRRQASQTVQEGDVR